LAINLNGFPYDSQIIGYGVDGLPEYDRASNSEEFASLLRSFWRDGVFGESALTVLAGSGMTVTVGTGSVLIQGRVARVTSAKTLTFDTADSQPRFDRVVARSDLSNSVRDIVLDVVKGIPASSPVAPALTRNQSKWELCLATVKIPANISVIQQSNITDTRLDSELCGLVAATMTDVDTTAFYEQIQNDLRGFREVEQNQFLEWFDSIRDVLDENAAGNLYNKIENLTAKIQGLQLTTMQIAPSSSVRFRIESYLIAIGRATGASSTAAVYVLTGYSVYRKPLVTEIETGSNLTVSTSGDNTAGWDITIANSHASTSQRLLFIGDGAPILEG
jgi:hypothetical protein